MVSLVLAAVSCYVLYSYGQKGAESMKNHQASLICLNEHVKDTKIIYLFVHGLDPRSSAAIKQARSYLDNNVIDGLCYTFSFNDSLRALNFGQSRDCQILAHAYVQLMEKHPESSVVIVGVSRGASTILNTLSTQKAVDFSRVKAVILESPFEHVETLTQHITKSYVPVLPHSWSHSFLHRLIRHCTLYDVLGIHAKESIKELPEHIDVFIAYSQEDATVPPQGTHSIITTLQESGRNVTHWVAQTGRHSTLSKQAQFKEEIDHFLRKHKD